MNRFEQKLIDLGYEKIFHNYKTGLTKYQKDLEFCVFMIFIKDNELEKYNLSPMYDFKYQYQIDNLQQAFDIFQQDLKEILKVYENN